MRTFIYIMALSILLCGSICFAASFPQTLNYQGTLQTKTGQQVNTPQDITFSLYTTPIGTELPFWTESLINVPVSNGQFSVTLGTVTPLDPARFVGETYLGIKVGTQAEMLPRQKMTSVPYAFNGIPQGGIIMWSGSTVPAGWALCDGSNGTPNLRDRFIVGAGTGYVVGATGGEATHVLTSAEMPSHTHLQDSHTHTQEPHNHINGVYSKLLKYDGAGTTSDTDNSGGEPNIKSYGDLLSATASNQSTTAINQNTGGGQAHENRPPYYALAFIMKL